MKKIAVVLLVLLVLSACQTSREPDYRILNDDVYIQVEDNRFEFEDQWIITTDMVGGYRMTYSVSTVIVEVKNSVVTVTGDTCTFTRQPSGLFQTDCDDTEKVVLMTYLDSVTLVAGETTQSALFGGSIVGYIAALIFIVILMVITGFLGFNTAALDAYFEFKAMFKLRYKDRPEYADWYKKQQMLMYRAFFVILIILFVLVFIFMLYS